ncbi:type II secretion system F family protein [Vibrio astriarenae]|uniref:Type II secretion system F family protein n=1 Tax=Vibrio astriarenae TaxID=1481923 RepID=A0A7Z2YE59_9VIBR|nr:type II secretion system F family protein [Vibrio astriarenae]QIA64068.1 type II secretion system F family protein [Vibrio astriarenae]
MEFIAQMIEQYVGDEQTIFLGLVLVCTILIVLTVSFLLLGTRSPIQDKLDSIKEDNSVGSTSSDKSNRLSNTLESLAPIMAPSSGKERETVRHKLMHAGYHDANALNVFFAIKGVSFIIGAAIGALLYFFMPDLDNLLLWIVASVAVGLFLPNIGLSRLVSKRQSKIRAGIPDALDLLVVCTESGLGFNAALRRVADELVISHPDLADELDTVCNKIKAGVEMSDAFQELVDRTGLQEIAGLASMLAHASRIGGSLAQTLREYTEDYRDRRNQEVEEIAAKIPTKMIFPLLLFIWPCFFIVAIGPALLSLSATLGN